MYEWFHCSCAVSRNWPGVLLPLPSNETFAVYGLRLDTKDLRPRTKVKPLPEQTCHFHWHGTTLTMMSTPQGSWWLGLWRQTSCFLLISLNDIPRQTQQSQGVWFLLPSPDTDRRTKKSHQKQLARFWYIRWPCIKFFAQKLLPTTSTVRIQGFPGVVNLKHCVQFIQNMNLHSLSRWAAVSRPESAFMLPEVHSPRNSRRPIASHQSTTIFGTLNLKNRGRSCSGDSFVVCPNRNLSTSIDMITKQSGGFVHWFRTSWGSYDLEHHHSKFPSSRFQCPIKTDKSRQRASAQVSAKGSSSSLCCGLCVLCTIGVSSKTPAREPLTCTKQVETRSAHSEEESNKLSTGTIKANLWASNRCPHRQHVKTINMSSLWQGKKIPLLECCDMWHFDTTVSPRHHVCAIMIRTFTTKTNRNWLRALSPELPIFCRLSITVFLKFPDSRPFVTCLNPFTTDRESKCTSFCTYTTTNNGYWSVPRLQIQTPVLGLKKKCEMTAPYVFWQNQKTPPPTAKVTENKTTFLTCSLTCWIIATLQLGNVQWHANHLQTECKN